MAIERTRREDEAAFVTATGLCRNAKKGRRKWGAIGPSRPQRPCEPPILGDGLRQMGRFRVRRLEDDRDALVVLGALSA